MKQIFIYSDSVSWGVIPNTCGDRFEFKKRWTGVFENDLNKKGYDVRVIEDCLNGRRTAWEDPKKDGRNGLIGISQKIETFSPLSLIIIMLGTNDFQAIHNVTSKHSAQGLSTLITKIKNSPIESGLTIPEILVIAPPLVLKPMGELAKKFQGAKKKCKNLANELQAIATGHNCYFFDSNSIVSASVEDGVHLDENQHKILGLHISDIVEAILVKNNDNT